MATSYVQSNAKTVAHGSSSTTLAFSSNNTAGNLIVVCVGFFKYLAGTASVSDSQGNTYTRANQQATGSTEADMWFAPNCNGGANTITISNTSTNVDFDVIIAEYSGADTISPLDAASGATSGSSATLSIGSSAGLLVVYAYNSNNNTATLTPSPSSGLTLRQHTSNSDGCESSVWDVLPPSAGAYTQSVTNSSTLIAASFKGGAAATNQPCMFIGM